MPAKKTTKKASKKKPASSPKRPVVKVVEEEVPAPEPDASSEPKATPESAPAEESAPKSKSEDLSRYTVGAGGKPEVPEENAQNNDTQEEAQPPKKRTIGFGLTPREKKVIDDDDVPFETKNRRLYFIGVVVSAFVLGATVATLYFRIQEGAFTQEEVAVQVEETAETTPESTATDSPSASPLARSEITLEILNGSGVAGAAGKSKTTFEGLGYSVDSVGNATEDVVGNQLYVDEDVNKDLLDNLLDDVKDELSIKKITGTSKLDTTAQIILGTEESTESAE